MLGQARGRFAAFVDDDDRVDERYVEQLLRAIRLAPEADCIVFDVIVHGPDSPARLCRYGTELEHGMDGEVYTRKPNHLMAYRRELALRHRYRDIGYGEDDEWAARASADIRIQHRIEAALYEYDWVPKPPSWYGSGRSEA
ncbi:glycosyltransferase family 2 protein [Paenibacillus albicereus]|uniref:Glycosyltransferase family 2 protein n=1 Tax=Paenibacillus albicereus TaxID=2726185 RepID=A0A6H2H446_9BACL|nr:glycosyltransferase family 2 protein [Paenibacillus albicereus]